MFLFKWKIGNFSITIIECFKHFCLRLQWYCYIFCVLFKNNFSSVPRKYYVGPWKIQSSAGHFYVMRNTRRPLLGSSRAQKVFVEPHCRPMYKPEKTLKWCGYRLFTAVRPLHKDSWSHINSLCKGLKDFQGPQKFSNKSINFFKKINLFFKTTL